MAKVKKTAAGGTRLGREKVRSKRLAERAEGQADNPSDATEPAKFSMTHSR